MGREPNEKNKSNIKIDNSINSSQIKKFVILKEFNLLLTVIVQILGWVLCTDAHYVRESGIAWAQSI